MKKIIEFLLRIRLKANSLSSKLPDVEYPEIVWNAEKIVETMIELCECDSSNKYQFTIPNKERIEWDYVRKSSEYYRYKMFKSALSAFRPDVEWKNVSDNDFLFNMIDPNFSEDKKAAAIYLLGNLNSKQTYLIEREETFDFFNRRDMIAMLIEYVCAIDELKHVWDRYLAVSLGGAVIRRFIINETNPTYKHQMKAMKLIAILLGDVYDQTFTRSELIEKFNYPTISPKEFGELVSEEMM